MQTEYTFTELIVGIKSNMMIREAAKSLGLGGIGIFFLTIKKVLFSLVAHLLSPLSLLMARPLRKDVFLRLPLLNSITLNVY